MSVIHAPRRPELDARILIFPIVLAPVLIGLFLRLWYLQVVLGSSLAERAEHSREMRVETLAPRGLLYDRHGKLIAGIKPEIVVTAVPAKLAADRSILPRVAGMLEVPIERLQDKLNGEPASSSVPVPIYVGATIQAGTRIAEAGDTLPGIEISTKPLRWYPDSLSFTHVLGYTRIPGEVEVEALKKRGLEPADYVGAGGIERAYEKELMGREGAEVLEVDARRRPLRVAGREAAIPGERLELSIDADLQKFAAQTIGKARMTGGVVALDPATGEILAMVSAPTYDQRLFEGGSISRKDWRALNDHSGKPLINRAIGTAAAPGSTFKIVTAIAAMQSGRSIANFSAFCPGEFRMGRGRIKCLGRHGGIGFTRAMEKSCNTFFCTMGRAVGAEALRKASLDCGLGNRTEIEITPERRGLIPTQKWLDLTKNPWYPGHTAMMAIGQGYVAATPLQMAHLAALVGNEGVAYRPHLLHAIRRPKGKTLIPREVANRVEAPAEFWTTLKGGLKAVIDSGTAKSARIPGVAWAGKTGSAEHRKGEETHAWFVGFAPAKNPKIAICVYADSAGHGGDFAAPIAGKIVAHYLAAESRRSKASAAAKAASASAKRLSSR